MFLFASATDRPFGVRGWSNRTPPLSTWWDWRTFSASTRVGFSFFHPHLHLAIQRPSGRSSKESLWTAQLGMDRLEDFGRFAKRRWSSRASWARGFVVRFALHPQVQIAVHSNSPSCRTQARCPRGTGCPFCRRFLFAFRSGETLLGFSTTRGRPFFAPPDIAAQDSEGRATCCCLPPIGAGRRQGPQV